MDAIFVAPSLLLLLAWVQVVRSRHSDRATPVSWSPLIVVTASEVYFWLSAASRGLLLGHDCSNVRYGLIVLNLLAAAAAAVVFCFRKSVSRWLGLAASLCLVLSWFLVAAISSVV
jgi:hypothetical protein